MKYINTIGVALIKQQRSGIWLAQQLGRHPATIYKWISNKQQPTLSTLIDIARVLQTTPNELLNFKI